MRARAKCYWAVLLSAMTLALFGRASADESAPISVATSWLEALKAGNGAALTSKTALSFVQSGLKCARSTATTAPPAARAALLGCIVGANSLFLESIPAEADAMTSLAGWRRMKLAELPRAQRNLAQKLPGAQLVGGALDGSGISFQVVLAITPDGMVEGLFVNLADNDAR